MVDDKLWEEMKSALNNIHVTNTYIEQEREVASPSAGLVDGERVGVCIGARVPISPCVPLHHVCQRP